MLLSFLKFPFPVLRHCIFFRISARFSFVYARRLVEEGVRQNPAFVQNRENVAKTGQIGDIVPHTFSEISKTFAAMAGVSGIVAKKWVDGKVDGDPLGKPANPCAPGVSAGRHRVDMGGFGAGCPSNATKSDVFSTLKVRVLKFIVRSHKCVSLDTIPG